MNVALGRPILGVVACAPMMDAPFNYRRAK
jgi:hypothetical protein